MVEQIFGTPTASLRTRSSPRHRWQRRALSAAAPGFRCGRPHGVRDERPEPRFENVLTQWNCGIVLAKGGTLYGTCPYRFAAATSMHMLRDGRELRRERRRIALCHSSARCRRHTHGSHRRGETGGRSTSVSSRSHPPRDLWISADDAARYRFLRRRWQKRKAAEVAAGERLSWRGRRGSNPRPPA